MSGNSSKKSERTKFMLSAMTWFFGTFSSTRSLCKNGCWCDGRKHEFHSSNEHKNVLMMHTSMARDASLHVPCISRLKLKWWKSQNMNTLLTLGCAVTTPLWGVKFWWWFPCRQKRRCTSATICHLRSLILVLVCLASDIQKFIQNYAKCCPSTRSFGLFVCWCRSSETNSKADSAFCWMLTEERSAFVKLAPLTFSEASSVSLLLFYFAAKEKGAK